MYVASQSTVCEWHQFQGLNEVIYSPYRQNFRESNQMEDTQFPSSSPSSDPAASVATASSTATPSRVVDGGVTATGVLSRERGNLITICNTL